MAKRRFGVSLPEDLARDLDRLSGLLGVERSAVVEEAVRHYLDDYRHLLVRHHCRGVILAACRGEARASDSVKKFKHVVAAHLHLHMDGICIDLLAVSGDSLEISRLIGHLKASGCSPRFLPAGEAESRG